MKNNRTPGGGGVDACIQSTEDAREDKHSSHPTDERANGEIWPD